MLAEVSFELKKGQKLAVLGENGKGKSTLLKTLVGQLEDLGGSVKFGRDVEWVYFDQELLNLDESKTVIEEFWDAYPNLMQTEVRSILGNFLFSGDDVFKPLSMLSGGEKVRLSLAKLLKRQANLLILDEPTNHLDMIGKEALEGMLKSYEGTILFVSHDRYFVQRIADSLLILEDGMADFYPYSYEVFQEKSKKNLRSEDASSLNPVLTTKMVGGNGSPSIKRGNDKVKRERRIAQLEKEITKLEETIEILKQQFSDPKIATDYQQLSELQEKINNNEQILNNMLFEWEKGSIDEEIKDE